MFNLITQAVCLIFGIVLMFSPNPSQFVAGTGYIVGTIWICTSIIISVINDNRKG